MGGLTDPDASRRLTPDERAVRSTALAYRFMVRRTLCRGGGACRPGFAQGLTYPRLHVPDPTTERTNRHSIP